MRRILSLFLHCIVLWVVRLRGTGQADSLQLLKAQGKTLCPHDQLGINR
jgi:hypothetical protein